MQQATTAHDRPGRRLGMRLLAMGLLGTGVLGTGLLGTGSPPASAAPRPASVVVDYADTGYVCLDPMWASTRPNDERMILSVFEGLARIDAQSGQPVPAAAERWERAPDGRSWTFTLRAGASWTDGTPLRAQDFVRAWKRILDPAPDAVSPWRARLRPLRGVAAMLDADHGRRTLERMGKRLSDLLAKRKEGIDAPELRDLVLAVGLRSVAGLEGNATLAPLLAWGDKRLVPAKAGEVLEALKAERRARKAPTFDAYDAFGVSQGVIARDERTLVVETEQPEPSLPALLARATFVPLPAALAEAKALGTDPSSFVGNGPWRLHQRGPAPAGSGRTPSVVHLQRSTTYRGPFEAKADELRCWTDEPGPDELRRYRAGEVGWLAAPMEEWKKDVEALPGFRTRPTPRVVLLRLRCDGAPFERREARRALALAVDRPALAKALWPAADPATRLLPPGASGAGPGARVLAADKAAALASLAAAGFKPPEREPAFDLRYAEEDQDLGAVAGRLSAGWARMLGVSEASRLIETRAEVPGLLRAGAYTAFLTSLQADTGDALAWLSTFSAARPDGGAGWRDDDFEALLAAARDPAAALRSGLQAGGALEARLDPAAREALARARATPGEAALEGLRAALLGQAEQRLLEEAVAIPLVVLRQAEVLGPLTGLGSEAAWAQPGFEGWLGDLRPR